MVSPWSDGFALELAGGDGANIGRWPGKSTRIRGRRFYPAEILALSQYLEKGVMAQLTVTLQLVKLNQETVMIQYRG
jgi:hypothetical protein